MSVSFLLRENVRRAAVPVVGALNFLVPKREQILLSSFPDLDDQIVSLLRWIEQNVPHSVPVAIVAEGTPSDVKATLSKVVPSASARIRIIQKWTLAALWAYWRSKIVIFTHGLYGNWPIPSRQAVVNAWHGMPLKKIWRGVPKAPAPSCSLLLSTSPRYSEILEKASGMPAARVKETGLPRNDLLLSRTPAVTRFNQTLREGVDRVSFFMPTYRKVKPGNRYDNLDGIESGSPLMMSNSDTLLLRESLRATRTRLLVKPHPISVHYGKEEQIDDNLWIVSDRWFHQHEVTLYEALGCVDLLLTDVSSVYIDFLVLRRPVIFFIPDLVAYRTSRAFILEPLEEWLAGPLCKDVRQVCEQLQLLHDGSDQWSDKREEIARVLNPQAAPDASSKTFKALLETHSPFSWRLP